MTPFADRDEAVTALLVRAEEAHGEYERTELKGMYDEQWPQWYAQYAIEQGIGELLGRRLTVDELSAFLASSYGEFKEASAEPGEEWAAYTARRIIAELA
jgi:hypothetical protein